jgi:CheY-like chemotaxis protein
MNIENKKSVYSILFVDDEDMARKYFAKGLQDSFNILTAANVVDAKKIIEENSSSIAIVITDQRMPGDNGVVLLEYLRNNHPQIIRLLTTAYSDLNDAINSVNKGEIFRYIQKPWDFALLKTELHQALELFETRLERDQLIQEKISVKKKISKIDRVKSLVLLARTLKSIRFADSSIENFIRQFAAQSHQKSEEDWDAFELGNFDLLETLFLVNIVDKVYNQISASSDYNFSNSFDGQQIVDLIKKEASDAKVNATTQLTGQLKNIEVNSSSLNVALKILFAQIASLSSETANISIGESQNGEEVSININLAKTIWPEAKNIFITPSNKNADLYVNLLICYLLIGHHGGGISVQYNDQQNVNFQINLPYLPKQVSAKDALSKESLDDMILLTMLE